MLKQHLLDLGYVRTQLDELTHPDLPSLEELSRSPMAGNPIYMSDFRGEGLAKQFTDQVGSPKEGDMGVFLVGAYHSLTIGHIIGKEYSVFFKTYRGRAKKDLDWFFFARDRRFASFLYPLDSSEKSNVALIIGETHMMDFNFPLPNIGVLCNEGIKRILFGMELYSTKDAENENWRPFSYNCYRISKYASKLRAAKIAVKFIGLDNEPRPSQNPFNNDLSGWTSEMSARLKRQRDKIPANNHQ